CFLLRGKWLCIGQTAGGQIACSDVQGGVRFTFDYGATWPLRFTADTASCQNYNTDYLQNLTWALGYNSFNVAQTKTGNSCPLTWIDANGNFASAGGDGGKLLPYDVTFTF